MPQRTISDLVQKQGEIEKYSSRITRNPHSVILCQWPELESQLYCLFLDPREQGQAVRTGWFRLHSYTIFRELYPIASGNTSTIFQFSNGWFCGFIGRYRISLRCITKKTQGVPEDYCQLIVNWLQFNRRNSQPPLLPNLATDITLSARLSKSPNPHNSTEIAVSRTIGRYDLSNICNLDETPLPFKYLTGRTYNPIGSKTVLVRESKSGWDKRQASLVLGIFGDGFNRVPPMILFHGQGMVYRKESPKYNPRDLVEFNSTAYMNNQLLLKYI